MSQSTNTLPASIITSYYSLSMYPASASREDRVWQRTFKEPSIYLLEPSC